MYSQALENIRELLIKFGLTKIEYYDDSVDGGFCGLDDTCSNYGYIRSLTNKNAINGALQRTTGESCIGYKSESNYRLVLDLKTKKGTKDEIIRVIIAILSEVPNVNIYQWGNQSEFIYQIEDSENNNKPLSECNLFVFDFKLTYSFECNFLKRVCLKQFL